MLMKNNLVDSVVTEACVCLRECASLRCGHDAGNTCEKTKSRMRQSSGCLNAGSSGRALTLKVDLLHDVLGLDALLLVEDEDLPLLVFRPAVLVHPKLHLRVCSDRRRVLACLTVAGSLALCPSVALTQRVSQHLGQ